MFAKYADTNTILQLAIQRTAYSQVPLSRNCPKTGLVLFVL